MLIIFIVDLIHKYITLQIINTRKQYNVQISQLTEELSALQMVC